MAEIATISRFEVIFDAEGVNTSKFRNDVKVHLRGPYAVSYELPTDEGGLHGGDGSAPYPLAYFTSALTACVMTQIRAFSKRLDIPVDRFSVRPAATGKRSKEETRRTKARRSPSRWT
jgi:uncharacterized OsmC-like protein